MIYCGNDITSVQRIEEAIKKQGELFLKRVYTDEEIEYCESRRMRKI
ncbi:MAG: 4'-phosphopantetheinyl transferase superfamily protein [Clostridia bacterium]|nr:4'-phosphopantetheinyl transferase superfamily protein [Clostridia bacterium]